MHLTRLSSRLPPPLLLPFLFFPPSCLLPFPLSGSSSYPHLCLFFFPLSHPVFRRLSSLRSGPSSLDFFNPNRRIRNMNDSADAPMTTPRPSNLPFREDCWSEDATHTLVEAWGERYIELNRGNLRQKHWQEVADAVNARHASGKKPRRTDVQCKNRIDTLKKKYKLEKARIMSSNGNLTSKWPFFPRLDSLIGSAASAKKTSPPVALPLPYHKTPPQALPHALVVRPPKEKRPSASPAADESYFRRNYSNYSKINYNHNFNYNHNGSLGYDADSGSSRSTSESPRSAQKVDGEGDGFRQLAQAIVRFGEIYERVEEAKQAQMIELEKQRMEFARMLECERMQLFMDSQLQMEKIKRARRTTTGTGCNSLVVVTAWKWLYTVLYLHGPNFI